MLKRSIPLAAILVGTLLNLGAFASSPSFDFQLDTTEAKRALEVCNYDLTMSFSPPSTLRITCDGAEMVKEIMTDGQKPIFDKITTLNKSVLVASQDIMYMKNFSPNMLRGHYNGTLALYTEEYLLELSQQAENLKLWADYI